MLLEQLELHWEILEKSIQHIQINLLTREVTMQDM